METQKIDIAVVILSWNGIEWIKTFLPTIIDKSSNANIYVADNASSDGTVDYIKENFTNVNVIQNYSNEGYAKGYNDALKNLNEKYFVLINSDIEVTDNWLNPIIDLMEDNIDIAACQPKILDYNNRNKFEYAGASGGYIDTLGYPYCRGRIFSDLEEDNNQYDDIKEVFWASGACLFVRSENFKEVNGFDNDFFAHQEEIDLCWRLKNSGYKVMVNPQSVVYHVGGGTLNSSSPFKTYLNFRNNLFMLYKNLPFLKLLITLLFRLPLDGIAAITFLKKEDGIGHLFSILRAHLVFYISIPLLTIKRSKIKQKRKVFGISNFSILFKYYALGIKKYSNL
jgi:GT2 family glycosyltransferase